MILHHFVSRMLELSINGEKEKADVINQMLMPLHERYVNYPVFSLRYSNIVVYVSRISFPILHFEKKLSQKFREESYHLYVTLHYVTNPLIYNLFCFILS